MIVQQQVFLDANISTKIEVISIKENLFLLEIL